MGDGRTKKAARNIIANLSNQLFSLVLSLVSRSVFIWGFGVGYLGINGLFADILSLLSMADLGFHTAMVYSFYKPLANNDYDRITALVNFYKKIYRIIATAISCIGLLLIPFLPSIINLDYEVPNLTWYYLLALSNVVVSYLCVYKTTILYADQKGYIVTRILIISNTAKTIAQIMSVFFWKNYFIFLFIGTVVTIGNNVFASKRAEKEYPYIKQKKSLADLDKKNIYKNLGSVFLYKVSSVLLNATDNVLISTIVSTVAVGMYSNYLMLQTKITSVFSLFFTSITSSVGNLVATESEKKRFEIFMCEQSVSFIFSGVVIPCYVLLVNDFIRIWLGNDYLLSNNIVYAIGFNMYLGCVLQPLWSFREATGLYRKTKWVMVICAALNLAFSILFGIFFGVFGVIIASAISRLLTYVWYEPRLLFREYFNTSEIVYYRKLILNFILIVCMIILHVSVWSFLLIDGVVLLFVKALAIGTSCFALMFLFYRKTDGFKLLTAKGKDLMIRIRHR